VAEMTVADEAALAVTERPDKPPYKVPTMDEVRAVPWNGLTVASTFSGAGGSCTGYRMAGYRVVWANEFQADAAESYKANASEHCYLNTDSIRQVDPADVLRESGLERGELDLFDGSPPCQSFSTAGKRHKGWGEIEAHADGTTQRSDDLFFDYARLVEGVQPKVFVAENVTGMVKGAAKGYFKIILQALKDCGYEVVARVIDGSWVGVPQARQRLIFIGVRNDLVAKGFRPVHPAPWPFQYTIADACPWLASRPNTPAAVLATGTESSNSGNTFPAEHRPAPTVSATGQSVGGAYDHGVYGGGLPSDPGADEIDSVIQPHDPENAFSRRWDPILAAKYKGGVHPADLTEYERAYLCAPPADVVEGIDPVDAEIRTSSESLRRKWETLVPGEGHEKAFNLRRSSPDEPSGTILAMWGNGSVHQVMPPFTSRRFTILEVKRLCSFPDDFILTGSFSARWARLGNAVPPLMMKAVSETIRDEILLPIRELES